MNASEKLLKSVGSRRSSMTSIDGDNDHRWFRFNEYKLIREKQETGQIFIQCLTLPLSTIPTGFDYWIKPAGQGGTYPSNPFVGNEFNIS